MPPSSHRPARKDPTARHEKRLAGKMLGMKAVVQRVTSAAVLVDGRPVGQIGTGLLVLVGVTHDDTAATAAALARKVHGLRIMRDELSVADLPGAAVLVVSQFTLYGDARKGRRPTWVAAAPAAVAEPLVNAFVAGLRMLGARVATGVFRADMQVESVNDGPITLLLEA
jgi:D-aminoacyl-tRNA deacylase